MGGRDKGLVELGSRPMISYILDSLRAQVSAMLVNANRNLERYRDVAGCTVFQDAIEGYAGPLAGMLTAMQRCRTEFLLTVPCDSPLLAGDLAKRLHASLAESKADISVAHDGKRMQPVFALLRTGLEPSLAEYLQSGERKIDTWYAHHTLALCDLSDRADTFLNINTPEERDRIEQVLETRG